MRCGTHRRAAKNSEKEIAMKDYLTPEMKFIRLMLSDVIEGSATVNSYKGETLQADTLISVLEGSKPICQKPEPPVISRTLISRVSPSRQMVNNRLSPT